VELTQANSPLPGQTKPSSQTGACYDSAEHPPHGLFRSVWQVRSETTRTASGAVAIHDMIHGGPTGVRVQAGCWTRSFGRSRTQPAWQSCATRTHARRAQIAVFLHR
jgi:hypothetical protein